MPPKLLKIYENYSQDYLLTSISMRDLECQIPTGVIVFLLSYELFFYSIIQQLKIIIAANVHFRFYLFNGFSIGGK
jgi:hypothetical protein